MPHLNETLLLGIFMTAATTLHLGDRPRQFSQTPMTLLAFYFTHGGLRATAAGRSSSFPRNVRRLLDLVVRAQCVGPECHHVCLRSCKHYNPSLPIHRPPCEQGEVLGSDDSGEGSPMLNPIVAGLQDLAVKDLMLSCLAVLRRRAGQSRHRPLTPLTRWLP